MLKKLNKIYERLNRYRIKERLLRGFVIASGVPALVAAIVLIVLIVIAKIYAGALQDYGFAQGDDVFCRDEVYTARMYRL